jgi:hypothetical protein
MGGERTVTAIKEGAPRPRNVDSNRQRDQTPATLKAMPMAIMRWSS